MIQALCATVRYYNGQIFLFTVATAFLVHLKLYTHFEISLEIIIKKKIGFTVASTSNQIILIIF